eukprot:10766824-Prorocentrum_lima.AAC.1
MGTARFAVEDNLNHAHRPSALAAAHAVDIDEALAFAVQRVWDATAARSRLPRHHRLESDVAFVQRRVPCPPG